MKLGLWLAEKGFIPDILLRVAIRKLSLTRLKDKSLLSEKSKIAASFKEGPIAEQTLEANEQHYEVPPSFLLRFWVRI
jgi:cyclopropane-fatty-acyl-phospholipid synthase